MIELYTINPTGKLLVNRWKSPDGTTLMSVDRHNFVWHFDEVLEQRVFVDGGLDYARTSGNLECMCLYDTLEEHQFVREIYHWGSRGISGDQPIVRKPIKDLTIAHIKNIIEYLTQDVIVTTNYPQVLNMFKREYNYRVLNNIE